MRWHWLVMASMTVGTFLLIASCGGDNGVADTRAVVERAIAAYEERDATAYAALYAVDARLDDFSALAVHEQGRGAVQRAYHGWFTDVLPPNRTFESKILIADEHMAVVEWSDEWSEDGESVRLVGIIVYEVEDGEIVHEATYYDAKPVERFLD